MKKVIIILLVILLSSCKNETSNVYSLDGNWSLIDLDSTYSEIKIQNNTIITYHENLSFLPLKSFNINGDSIFISESIKNQVDIRSFLLNNSDDENYYFSSQKMNGKIVLKKIDSSQYTFDKLKDLKETLRFKIDFENRKNELLGINKRYSYSDTIIKASDKKVDTATIKLNF